MDDSLLPEQFHIMKTKAVVGLEFQSEQFTTKLKELQHDLSTNVVVTIKQHFFGTLGRKSPVITD